MITLSMTNRQRIILAALFLTMLNLVVYFQTHNFDFVNYDDQIYVTKNYNIQSGLTFKTLIYSFKDARTAIWHPLTMLSHALDWQLFGNKAGGHHWTNLILHIFNTILLFLLLNTMTGAIWRSAAVAALFAVHPINVESVAWVAERKNVLSTFFWFLTILFYVRYVRKPGWKRYLPVFFCFALGLMAKPMLVTLPLVLLLMDYWPLNRTPLETKMAKAQTTDPTDSKAGWGLLIYEKIPLFTLTVIFSGVAFYTQNQANTMSDFGFITMADRVNNALWSYVLYLKKMIWPVDLAVFYPFVAVPLKQAMAAFVLLSVITGICCKYYKRHPYLIVGWLWFLGTLVPVIGLIQVGAQSMADRYAYVPLIGIFILTIWMSAEIANRLVLKKAAASFFLVILALLIYTAHSHVQSWRNNYTLYTHAINTAAPNILPYKNLSLAMIEENKPYEAAKLLDQAVRIDGNEPSLRNSLGVALVMLGKYPEAEEQYKEALRLHPRHDLAHNNLGMLYMNQGRTDEAMKHFEEAIKIQPQFANAHYRLSLLLKQKGLNEKALYHLNEAVKINPEFGSLKN